MRLSRSNCNFMHVVLLTHPRFLGSQSMPRFAEHLKEGLERRGAYVEALTPKPFFYLLGKSSSLKKWLGYLDQYIVFPLFILAKVVRLRKVPNRLYVLCDQALGPWVPFLRFEPHVIHAHDLLALRSALGLIPENPTSLTGRVYQRLIRFGFRMGSNFIAVSSRTKSDLERFGGVSGDRIRIVFNSLNYSFRLIDFSVAEAEVSQLGVSSADGWLLHVGGGQWYKNTIGVLKIYHEYAARRGAAGKRVLPLVMVSPGPTPAMERLIDSLPDSASVVFLREISAFQLNCLYSGCVALLFPSLAEGFGWPIIEVQACGSLVLTTAEEPMSEISGPSAYLVPRFRDGESLIAWSKLAADRLDEISSLTPNDRRTMVDAGLEWVRQFDPEKIMNSYFDIYSEVASGKS